MPQQQTSTMVLTTPRQAPVMSQKPQRRRTRSKGTIVAYGNDSSVAAVREASESHPSMSSSIVSSQPQHVSESSPGGPSKPCNSARLALLAVKNAIRLGARVQLYLCPPGRARRDLQGALRQRVRSSPGRRILAESGGYYGLEKLLGSDKLVEYDAQEKDFLLRTNTYDDDSDEEASSGDEDDVITIEELFSEVSAPLDEQMKDLNAREPLYVAAGTESNGNGPLSAMGPGAPGKLPFNWRKLRYFDLITAADSANARKFVQKELRRSRLRDAVMLSRHLRRAQREERLKRRMANGEPVDDLDTDGDTPEEMALMNNSVEPFPGVMTPAASAALLLESLTANTRESLEGMEKCYDGIVAAGVALLDSYSIDPTSLQSSDSETRLTRSEVLAALAPLLTTSLEQVSGEVILMLAKLRRMCATQRYQRRFVQRVAPSLIRPPRAAMWCLRHQNDMEAILAAAELIFDSAFEIFDKGWYERGRQLLADSKRAKTLDSAAKQLRNLSSGPSDGLVLNFPGQSTRRRQSVKTTRKGDASNDVLAKWEVIVVDLQIRVSISNVLALDWSRTSVHADIPRPHNRRATMSNNIRRISALPQSSSSEMSPRSGPGPRSPSRQLGKHTPQSPPHMASHPEGFDNVFASPAERPGSPPPLQSLQRSRSRERAMTPPKSPKSPTRHHPVDPLKTLEQAQSISSATSPKRSRPGSFGAKDTVGAPPAPSQPSTPLSPSSVGTSGSTGDMISYRPAPTASSNSATSSAMAHYRMLTATPAERKRTVAACRALRAQISRFEEAFTQLHGRPPRGAADRAPLASTYSQYRDWKRAIRADAASRIQALLRGACLRSRLIRTNDPRIIRIVTNKAGRPSNSDAKIDAMLIPEIAPNEERPRGLPSSPTSQESPSSASSPTLAPKWPRQMVRPRNSLDRDPLPPASTTSTPPHPPGPLVVASPPSVAPSDAIVVSLADLQNRKRDLKQQLKQYDMNFARTHGRMPVKAEKEPIRHLYESYNALKSQITRLEREARHAHSAPASPVAVPMIPQAQPRTVSPTSGSDSLSGDDSPARGAPPPSRRSRVLPRSASPPVSTASSASSPGSGTPTGPINQDLAALKAEKSRLHQMLRNYERDFLASHNRQVSSFTDIRPVANQYRRYKEIKRAIAQLQQRQDQQARAG